MPTRLKFLFPLTPLVARWVTVHSDEAPEPPAPPSDLQDQRQVAVEELRCARCAVALVAPAFGVDAAHKFDDPGAVCRLWDPAVCEQEYPGNRRRRNYGYDQDCCAGNSTSRCASSFAHVETTDVCSDADDSDSTGNAYRCYAPAFETHASGERCINVLTSSERSGVVSVRECAEIVSFDVACGLYFHFSSDDGRCACASDDCATTNVEANFSVFVLPTKFIANDNFVRSTVGSYTVEYSCTTPTASPATVSRSVTVRDALDRLGSNEVKVFLTGQFGSAATWTDPGASCVRHDLGGGGLAGLVAAGERLAPGSVIVTPNAEALAAGVVVGSPAWVGCFEVWHSDEESAVLRQGANHGTESCRAACATARDSSGGAFQAAAYFLLRAGECLCTPAEDPLGRVPARYHDFECGLACTGEEALVPMRRCGTDTRVAMYSLTAFMVTEDGVVDVQGDPSDATSTVSCPGFAQLLLSCGCRAASGKCITTWAEQEACTAERGSESSSDVQAIARCAPDPSKLMQAKWTSSDWNLFSSTVACDPPSVRVACTCSTKLHGFDAVCEKVSFEAAGSCVAEFNSEDVKAQARCVDTHFFSGTELVVESLSVGAEARVAAACPPWHLLTACVCHSAGGACAGAYAAGSLCIAEDMEKDGSGNVVARALCMEIATGMLLTFPTKSATFELATTQEGTFTLTYTCKSTTWRPGLDRWCAKGLLLHGNRCCSSAASACMTDPTADPASGLHACSDGSDVDCAVPTAVVTSTRQVKVVGAVKWTGDDTLYFRAGAGVWTDSTATCESVYGNSMELRQEPSELPLSAAGSYTVTYTCTDSALDATVRSVHRERTIVIQRDALMLFGTAEAPDIPALAQVGQPWPDPSGRCVDVNGGLLAVTAEPAVLDASRPATINVTYTCIDAHSITHTASRPVTVTGGMPVAVLLGPDRNVVPVPPGQPISQVCCLDRYGQEVPAFPVPLPPQQAPSVEQHLCGGLGGAWVAADAAVRVNAPPEVVLNGPTYVLSHLGSTYTDAGASCIDPEDGVITTALASGGTQRLPIFRASATGPVDGPLDVVFDGVLEPDGAAEAIASQGCTPCAVIAAGGSVTLDLGNARVVHRVTLYGRLSKATVRLGGATGNVCWEELGDSLRSSLSAPCAVPATTRFVTLSGCVEQACLLELCEAEVEGEFGPPVPGYAVLVLQDCDTNQPPTSYVLALGPPTPLGVSYEQQEYEFDELGDGSCQGIPIRTLLIQLTPHECQAQCTADPRCIYASNGVTANADAECRIFEDTLCRTDRHDEGAFTSFEKRSASSPRRFGEDDFACGGVSLLLPSPGTVSESECVEKCLTRFTCHFVSYKDGTCSQYYSCFLVSNSRARTWMMTTFSGHNFVAATAAGGAGHWSAPARWEYGCDTQAAIPLTFQVLAYDQGGPFKVSLQVHSFSADDQVKEWNLFESPENSGRPRWTTESPEFTMTKGTHRLEITGSDVGVAILALKIERGKEACAFANWEKRWSVRAGMAFSDVACTWTLDTTDWGRCQSEAFARGYAGFTFDGDGCCFKGLTFMELAKSLQEDINTVTFMHAEAHVTLRREHLPLDGLDGAFQDGLDGVFPDYWTLRSAEGEVLATAPGGSNVLPLDGWQQPQACASAEVMLSPPDACSWLLGATSHDSTFKCADLHSCTMPGCCNARSSEVMRCPRGQIMCNEKSCGGDHCCATDCGNYGGPRSCGLHRGEPAADAAPALSLLEISASVFSARPGLYQVLHVCTDSAGASSFARRSVRVGCEDYNHVHAFGGDSVECIQEIGKSDQHHLEACATLCLEEEACQAFTFTWLSECVRYTQCDGSYYQTGSSSKSAYCRRTDQGPSVVLLGGTWTTNVGESWTPVQAVCNDREDDVQPTATVNLGEYNHTQPGAYLITYTCEDSKQQRGVEQQTVLVRSDCNPLPRCENGGAHGSPLDEECIHNSHEDGMCVEGPAPVKHGQYCTLRCENGYAPQNGALYCTSEETAYESRFDHAPVCIEASCIAPSAENVRVDAINRERPCYEDWDAAGIPSQGTCTVACGPSPIAPSVNTFPVPVKLFCDSGILDPPSFRCDVLAPPVKALIATERGVRSVKLEWVAQQETSADCTHNGWGVEGALLPSVSSSSPLEWVEVDGCKGLLHADRMFITSCIAQALQDGQTYTFRIRELCLDASVNGTWVELGSGVQLTFAESPQDLLHDPAATIYSAAPMVLLVCQVSLDLLAGTATIYRTCTHSLADQTLSVTADEVAAQIDTQELGSVKILNNNIFMWMLPEHFMQPGCTFTITIPAGFVETSSSNFPKEPSGVPVHKPNPLWQWNSEFIDERPKVVSLSILSQVMVQGKGVQANFVVSFSIPSEFVCRLARTEGVCDWQCYMDEYDDALDEAPPGASYTMRLKAAEDHYQDYGKAENRSCGCSSPQIWTTAELVQDISFADNRFTIEELPPRATFTLNCSGNKRLKTHVKTEDHTPLQLNTMIDDDNHITAMVVRTFLGCPSGTTEAVERRSTIDMSILMDGLASNRQGISLYEEKCKGGQVVADQEVASFAFRLEVSTASHRAHMLWEVNESDELVTVEPWGAHVQLEFHKGVDETIKKREVVFYVCSDFEEQQKLDSKETSVPCQRYSITLQVLDLVVTVLDICVNGKCTGQIGMEPHVVDGVASGMEAELAIDLGAANDELKGAEVYIGHRDRGFTQLATFEMQRFKWTLQGVGLNVPLGVSLPSFDVLLDTYVRINFVAPTITVQALQVKLIGDLARPSVRLTGLPTEQTILAAATPTDFLKLVLLAARPEVGNLCGETTFDDPDDWTRPTCVVRRASYLGLHLQLHVWDFDRFDMVEASNSSPDIIQYVAPEVATIGRDDLEHPTRRRRVQILTGSNGMFKLSAFSSQDRLNDVLDLYVTSQDTSWPASSEVDTDKASLRGYQLLLHMPAGDGNSSEMPLCDVLARHPDEVNLLVCKLRKCMDARLAEVNPAVRLQLGDLRSDLPPTAGIEVPQPNILSYEPMRSMDVGFERFTIIGSGLGLPCCEEGQTFQQACDEWLASGRDISTTGIQTFGPVHVEAGAAPCVIESHRDQEVICVATEAKRPARQPLRPGQAYGDIIGKQDVTLGLRLGASLGALRDTTLKVSTGLGHCPDGYRRIAEDQAECEPCPAGHFSNLGTEQFPLQCTSCSAGEYQDEEGGTACKACPENTVSVGLLTSAESCRCLPGFYSPYLHGLGASPGKSCLSCSTMELTAQATPTMKCGGRGGLPVKEVCDDPASNICTDVETSILHRICMAYCPGGTQWPRAKGRFFLERNVTAQSKQKALGTGLVEFRALMVACENPDACMPGNTCAQGYTGLGCRECDLNYYKADATNCKACSEDENTTMVIMGVGLVVLTFGSFFGSLVYMKCQMDPIAKDTLVGFAKARLELGQKYARQVVHEVKMRMAQRVRVHLTDAELGQYRNWLTRGEIGLVYRVDSDTQAVRIAGCHRNSPAWKAGVRAHWWLVVANRSKICARSSEEVTRDMSRLRAPIVLTFRAPRFHWVKGADVDESADIVKETTSSAMRVLTMSWGVLQTFNVMASLTLKWPPEFQKIKDMLSIFSFKIDLASASCYQQAAWEYTWMAPLSFPYLVVFLVSFTMGVLRVVTKLTTPASDTVQLEVRNGLLTNAWMRACNTGLLVLFPSHLEQLTLPLKCTTSSTAPDEPYMIYSEERIFCLLSDPRYFRITAIMTTGFISAGIILSVFLVALYRSFYWQARMLRHDWIPPHVALVEVSVTDMNGHCEAVRQQVYRNVFATKVFLDEGLGEKGRELLEKLEVEPGVVVPETASSIGTMTQGRAAWAAGLSFPQELSGNVLTYSWIIVVNTIGRPFLTMLTVNLCERPEYSGALQMLVFTANSVAISWWKPYKNGLLNTQESFLLGCMAVLIGSMTLMDLLSGQSLLAQRPGSGVSTSMEVASGSVRFFVAVMVCAILGVLVFNVVLISKSLVGETGDEEAADNLAFERHVHLEELGACACAKRMGKELSKMVLAHDAKDAKETEMDLPLEKLEDEVDELVARLRPEDRVRAARCLQTAIDVVCLGRKRALPEASRAKRPLEGARMPNVELALLREAWAYGSRLQHIYELSRDNNDGKDIFLTERDPVARPVTQLDSRVTSALSIEYPGDDRVAPVFAGLLERDGTTIGRARFQLQRDADSQAFLGVLTKWLDKQLGAQRYGVFGWDSAQGRANVEVFLRYGWRSHHYEGLTVFGHVKNWLEEGARRELDAALERLCGEYHLQRQSQSVRLKLAKAPNGDVLCWGELLADCDRLVGVLQPLNLDPLSFVAELALPEQGRWRATLVGSILLCHDVENDELRWKYRSLSEEETPWSEIQEATAVRVAELVGKKRKPFEGARVCAVCEGAPVDFPEGTVVQVEKEGFVAVVRHDDPKSSLRNWSCGYNGKYELVFMTDGMEAALLMRVMDESEAQVTLLVGDWGLDATEGTLTLVRHEDVGRLRVTLRGEMVVTLKPEGAQDLGACWCWVGSTQGADNKELHLRVQYHSEKSKLELTRRPWNKKGVPWRSLPSSFWFRLIPEEPPQQFFVSGAGISDGRYVLANAASAESGESDKPVQLKLGDNHVRLKQARNSNWAAATARRDHLLRATLRATALGPKLAEGEDELEEEGAASPKALTDGSFCEDSPIVPTPQLLIGGGVASVQDAKVAWNPSSACTSEGEGAGAGDGDSSARRPSSARPGEGEGEGDGDSSGGTASPAFSSGDESGGDGAGGGVGGGGRAPRSRFGEGSSRRLLGTPSKHFSAAKSWGMTASEVLLDEDEDEHVAGQWSAASMEERDHSGLPAVDELAPIWLRDDGQFRICLRSQYWTLEPVARGPLEPATWACRRPCRDGALPHQALPSDWAGQASEGGEWVHGQRVRVEETEAGAEAEAVVGAKTTNTAVFGAMPTAADTRVTNQVATGMRVDEAARAPSEATAPLPGLASNVSSPRRDLSDKEAPIEARPTSTDAALRRSSTTKGPVVSDSSDEGAPIEARPTSKGVGRHATEKPGFVSKESAVATKSRGLASSLSSPRRDPCDKEAPIEARTTSKGAGRHATEKPGFASKESAVATKSRGLASSLSSLRRDPCDKEAPIEARPTSTDAAVRRNFTARLPVVSDSSDEGALIEARPTSTDAALRRSSTTRGPVVSGSSDEGAPIEARPTSKSAGQHPTEKPGFVSKESAVAAKSRGPAADRKTAGYVAAARGSSGGGSSRRKKAGRDRGARAAAGGAAAGGPVVNARTSAASPKGSRAVTRRASSGASSQEAALAAMAAASSAAEAAAIAAEKAAEAALAVGEAVSSGGLHEVHF